MAACLNRSIDTVTRLVQHENIDINAQENKYGDTALMIACKNRGEKIVSHLLQHKEIDVNVKNKRGDTALMIACENGDEKIVSHLLQHKEIDVNAKDKYGDTALMIACKEKNEKIVSCLLQHEKIDINATGHDGKTPLMLACGDKCIASKFLKRSDLDLSKMDEKTIKKIISKFPDDPTIKTEKTKTTEEALAVLAYKKGFIELVCKILQVTAATSKSENTHRLFRLACLNGHKNFAHCLFRDHKINVDEAGEGGVTALMMAAHNGHEEIVNWLCEIGANTEIVNNRGYTAHDAVLCHNSIISASFVRYHKDNPRAATCFGYSPKKARKQLMCFAANPPETEDDYGDIIPLLKQMVAVSVDALNKEMLKLAMQNGNKHFAEKFIEFDKMTFTDEEIAETLFFAAQYGSQNIMKALSSHDNFNVNAQDGDGRTALMFAATNGSEEIVEWLVKCKKINLEQKDKDNKRALQYARNAGHEHCVTLINNARRKK